VGGAAVRGLVVVDRCVRARLVRSCGRRYCGCVQYVETALSLAFEVTEAARPLVHSHPRKLFSRLKKSFVGRALTPLLLGLQLPVFPSLAPAFSTALWKQTYRLVSLHDRDFLLPIRRAPVPSNSPADEKERERQREAQRARELEREAKWSAEDAEDDRKFKDDKSRLEKELKALQTPSGGAPVDARAVKRKNNEIRAREKQRTAQQITRKAERDKVKLGASAQGNAATAARAERKQWFGWFLRWHHHITDFNLLSVRSVLVAGALLPTAHALTTVPPPVQPPASSSAKPAAADGKDGKDKKAADRKTAFDRDDKHSGIDESGGDPEAKQREEQEKALEDQKRRKKLEDLLSSALFKIGFTEAPTPPALSAAASADAKAPPIPQPQPGPTPAADSDDELPDASSAAAVSGAVEGTAASAALSPLKPTLARQLSARSLATVITAEDAARFCQEIIANTGIAPPPPPLR
jgi:hypothetical protein